MLIDRRGFLSRVGAAALPAARLVAAEERAFRLVVITGGVARIEAGFAVGVNEARRTAVLLGIDWASTIASSSWRQLRISALSLGRNAAPARYSVRASAAARARALQAWRRTHAGSPASAAVEWHPALKKFGGEQLNDRLAGSGREPDSDMWAGWMAVKVVAEATARHGGRAIDAAALVALAFDGHKGTPLRFDASDDHLCQPLCIVSADGALLGTIDAEEGK
jgi:hypothetical protein